MSKPKITPAAKPKQDTVPLSAITITWPERVGDFDGGNTPESFTLTGAQLAQIVAWVGRAHVGSPGREPVFDLKYLYVEFSGLPELLRALSTVDFEYHQIDTAPLLALVARIAEQQQACLAVADDVERYLKDATVAIGRPAQAVAS